MRFHFLVLGHITFQTLKNFYVSLHLKKIAVMPILLDNSKIDFVGNGIMFETYVNLLTIFRVFKYIGIHVIRSE